jgi:hypothetical protein
MRITMADAPDTGRATRPSGLHAVPDSQRAERYQAINPPLDYWGASPKPVRLPLGARLIRAYDTFIDAWESWTVPAWFGRAAVAIAVVLGVLIGLCAVFNVTLDSTVAWAARFVGR